MQSWQKNIIFYILIIMMASLFISRVALSISTIAFFAVSFFHSGIRAQIREFFNRPLLWGMSLLFLLPLLTGLWSSDQQEWQNNMRTKLPLLLFPLAFASLFTLTPRQWRWLIFVFCFLVTVGTLWSMWHYLPNASKVNVGYLRATSMLTPLGNDHVRFSWLIAVCITVLTWVVWDNRKHRLAPLVLFVIAWLIVYLHILAARTGLLCFFAFLIGALVWLAVTRRNRLQATGLLVILIALPIGAYFSLPTFRNKIKYFQYDFTYAKDAHYLPGGNDATRIISLKGGWMQTIEHPVGGVGFGDIQSAMEQWYQLHYPDMLAADRIMPSSEWLIYGTCAGLPGIVLFTFVLLLPFFIIVQNRLRWWMLNLLVCLGFLFDIGLEIQFGVFIYCLTVLLAWKRFRVEPRKG
ncbi:MAG: hypothetical protein H7Y42_05515 [Chitinophagaceae bacterium]|nr:hypothetical protein [Chitinophagaceae bacterium]